MSSRIKEMGMCASVHVHAQSCPTLCNPMDCSSQGSSFHGFSRQEYWSGLPFLPPGVFPTQGLNQSLLYLLQWQADSLLLHHMGSPRNRTDCWLSETENRRWVKWRKGVKMHRPSVINKYLLEMSYTAW